VKNQWELWQSVLSPEYCDYIIKRAMRHPEEKATIGFQGQNKEDANYRSSFIRWLDVDNEDSDIAKTLMNIIQKSNRNNFGFDINQMNEIQFTEYYGTDKGHYNWHHDVFWENEAPYDRKLSIVVQLSDPLDYDGGRFEFFGCESPNPLNFSMRGSALVFPSFFPHRVHPVTRGHRISLVSWIEGPKWR
jgi:PKHD-type hydroxylase